MPVNVTQGGARQEQRMRYMCRAHLSDPHELQIGRRKVETRFCPNDGTAACETDSKLSGGSVWSAQFGNPSKDDTHLPQIHSLCYAGYPAVPTGQSLSY